MAETAHHSPPPAEHGAPPAGGADHVDDHGTSGHGPEPKKATGFWAKLGGESGKPITPVDEIKKNIKDKKKPGKIGRIWNTLRGKKAEPASTSTGGHENPPADAGHTNPATEPEPAPIRTEHTQTQEHTPAPLPGEVTIGMAAVQKRIEFNGQRGREMLEERSIELARLMISENRQKWEGRFSGIRRFPERFWKFTLGEVPTYSKEKAHAVKLLGEAGLQMNNIDATFFNAIDAAARTRLAPRRSGIMGGIRGVSDVFNEVTFREGALHNTRLQVMRELRQAVENPNANQNNDPAFLALLGQYQSIRTGDYQASEALASRMTTEFGSELLNATIGEKMAAQTTELQGPAADFFKQNVIKRLLTEGLATNGAISEATLMQTRREIQDFFVSKDFITWYDQQPQAVRDNLDLSASYGTDMIPLIQEAILPQILQAREHMQSAANLDNYINEMVLKVQVGTLEGGQRGIIDEGIMERAATRSITNQRVQEMYRRIRAGGTAPRLASDRTLNAGATWTDAIVGNFGRVATHQVLMGVGTGLALYGAQRGATLGSNVLMPVLGGSIVSGALKGLQEHRLVQRERQQHDIESEVGYTFSQDMRRRQEMERGAYQMKDMQLDLVDPMQQILSELNTNNTLPEARALQLLGLIADTKARFGIGGVEGRGLLKAGSGAYDVEEKNLRLSTAQAMRALNELTQRNPQLLAQLQTNLNIQNVPAGNELNYIVSQLTVAQEKYIREGTGQTADYQAALGNVTVAEADSMRRRDRVQARMHARRVAGAVAQGAVTPLIGFGVTYGAHEAFNAAASHVLSNNTLGIGSALENIGLLPRRNDMFMGADLRQTFDNALNAGNVDLNNNLQMQIDPDKINGDYKFTIFDKTTGKTLPGHMWLHDNPNGHPTVIIPGRFDQLPPEMQQALRAIPRHETDNHNMLAHVRNLAKVGPDKVPDEVIGGEHDYKGNFLLNTHDIHQSNHLNPKGLSYDEWAAKEGKIIDPSTGKIEVGHGSVTAPDGTRIHLDVNPNGWIFNADGSFHTTLHTNGNQDLLANPAKLQGMIESMKAEGWDISKSGDTYTFFPPTATEYDISGYQFEPTHGGVPLPLSWRRPLERPENVRRAAPPLLSGRPQPTEPEVDMPHAIPPAPGRGGAGVPPAPVAPRRRGGADDDEPVPAPVAPNAPEDDWMDERWGPPPSRQAPTLTPAPPARDDDWMDEWGPDPDVLAAEARAARRARPASPGSPLTQGEVEDLLSGGVDSPFAPPTAPPPAPATEGRRAPVYDPFENDAVEASVPVPSAEWVSATPAEAMEIQNPEAFLENLRRLRELGNIYVANNQPFWNSETGAREYTMSQDAITPLGQLLTTIPGVQLNEIVLQTGLNHNALRMIADSDYFSANLDGVYARVTYDSDTMTDIRLGRNSFTTRSIYVELPIDEGRLVGEGTLTITVPNQNPDREVGASTLYGTITFDATGKVLGMRMSADMGDFSALQDQNLNISAILSAVTDPTNPRQTIDIYPLLGITAPKPEDFPLPSPAPRTATNIAEATVAAATPTSTVASTIPSVTPATPRVAVPAELGRLQQLGIDVEPTSDPVELLRQAHSAGLGTDVTEEMVEVAIQQARALTPPPPVTPIAGSEVLESAAPAVAEKKPMEARDREEFQQNLALLGDPEMDIQEAVTPLTRLVQTLPGVQTTKNLVSVPIRRENSLSVRVGTGTAAYEVEVYPGTSQIYFIQPSTAPMDRSEVGFMFTPDGQMRAGRITIFDSENVPTEVQFDAQGNVMRIDGPESTAVADLPPIDIQGILHDFTDHTRSGFDMRQQLRAPAATDATATASPEEVPSEAVEAEASPAEADVLDSAAPNSRRAARWEARERRLIERERVAARSIEIPDGEKENLQAAMERLRTNVDTMTPDQKVEALMQVLHAFPGVRITEAMIRDRIDSLQADENVLSLKMIDRPPFFSDIYVTYPTSEDSGMIMFEAGDEVSKRGTQFVIEITPEMVVDTVRVLVGENGKRLDDIVFYPQGTVNMVLSTTNEDHTVLPRVNLRAMLEAITDPALEPETFDGERLLEESIIVSAPVIAASSVVSPASPMAALNAPAEASSEASPAETEVFESAVPALAEGGEAAAETRQPLEIKDPAQFSADLAVIREAGDIYAEANKEWWDALGTDEGGGTVAPRMERRVVGPLVQMLSSVPGIEVNEHISLSNLSADDSNFAIKLGEKTHVNILYPTDENPNTRVFVSKVSSGENTTTTLSLSPTGEILGGEVVFNRFNVHADDRTQDYSGTITFDRTGRVEGTAIDPRFGQFSEKTLDIPTILQTMTNPATVNESISVYNVLPLKAPAEAVISAVKPASVAVETDEVDVTSTDEASPAQPEVLESAAPVLEETREASTTAPIRDEAKEALMQPPANPLARLLNMGFDVRGDSDPHELFALANNSSLGMKVTREDVDRAIEEAKARESARKVPMPSETAEGTVESEAPAESSEMLDATAEVAAPEAASSGETLEIKESEKVAFQTALERLRTERETMTTDEKIAAITQIVQAISGVQTTEAMIREHIDSSEVTNSSLFLPLLDEPSYREDIFIEYPTDKTTGKISFRVDDPVSDTYTELRIHVSNEGIQSEELSVRENSNSIIFELLNPDGMILEGGVGQEGKRINIVSLLREMTEPSVRKDPLLGKKILEAQLATTEDAVVEPAPPEPDVVESEAPAAVEGGEEEQAEEMTAAESLVKVRELASATAAEWAAWSHMDTEAQKETPYPEVGEEIVQPLTKLLDAFPGMNLSEVFVKKTFESNKQAIKVGSGNNYISFDFNDNIDHNATIFYPGKHTPGEFKFTTKVNDETVIMQLEFSSDMTILDGRLTIRDAQRNKKEFGFGATGDISRKPEEYAGLDHLDIASIMTKLSDPNRQKTDMTVAQLLAA